MTRKLFNESYHKQDPKTAGPYFMGHPWTPSGMVRACHTRQPSHYSLGYPMTYGPGNQSLVRVWTSMKLKLIENRRTALGVQTGRRLPQADHPAGGPPIKVPQDRFRGGSPAGRIRVGDTLRSPWPPLTIPDEVD
jgi:hypothetical protein